MNKKDFWIGIGIGCFVGVGGGFVIGNQVTKKHARRDIKRIRHESYIHGVSDGKAESSAEIRRLENDLYELNKNVVYVESTASAEDIQKAVEAKSKAIMEEMSENTSEGVEAVKRPLEGQIEVSTKQVLDDIPEEKPKLPDEMNFIGIDTDGKDIIFANGVSEPLRYPKWLFLTNNGEMRDIMAIRTDLKKYEKRIINLAVIWNRMGWGSYVPDPDSVFSYTNDEITDEEMHEMDLNFADIPEPEEAKAEREKYLNEVERYTAHPEEAPRIISRDEFEEECHLEQGYYNYYDVDNKFMENTDTESDVGAFDMFGVVNGNDLFNKKKITDDDEDPDIVYVKNFAENCVIEVTRWHRSSASIKDGSAYVDGGSGQV